MSGKTSESWYQEDAKHGNIYFKTQNWFRINKYF